MGASQSVTHDLTLESWILVTLEFCSFSTIVSLRTLCTLYNRMFFTENFHYLMCMSLQREYGLYIPQKLDLNESWKDKMKELYSLRSLWTKRNGDQFMSSSNPETFLETNIQPTKRYKINVFAKFRPIDNRGVLGMKEYSYNHQSEVDSDSHHVDSVEVTLPLHQRLSMIKMSHNITNNRKALQILASEGAWFANKWSARVNENAKTSILDIENRNESNFGTNNPLIGGIKAEKLVARVQSIDPVNGKVVLVTKDVGLREFSFDGVLPPSCSPQLAYDRTTRSLVCDLMNGFNTTVLVYGQTSSGKTYTMFGSEGMTNMSASSSRHRSGEFGIISMACNEIFDAVEKRRVSNKIDAFVSVSYVEVFGDRISDLLKDGSRCGHSKAAAQQYVLQGAAENPVDTFEDVMLVLAKGDACKRRAATAMNDRSTRAHSVFILTLRQTYLPTGVSRTSKFFLADLGGSEKVKKSKVDESRSPDGLVGANSIGFQFGDRMREAVYINLGLLSLKKCIEALNNYSDYVPYQDSKLTMLLSSGLGGNSKTSVIVCSRLEADHLPETISTLRFGEKCSQIENKISSENYMLQNILKNLDAQIQSLEAVIVSKERWELVEDRREDVLAEDGTLEKAVGGVEIRMVTRLVGAEKERQELESLLKRRSQFIGVNPIDSNASKGVKAFGKELAETYGIGSKYDAASEDKEVNERFVDVVKKEHIPIAARKRIGWAQGISHEENQETLARNAIKIKRNKLKFAGISI